MHLKRQEVPKRWPITRKGTKYVVRPNSNIHYSIPVLILIRDILKIAQNRKEMKKTIHERSVILNGKIVRNEKIPIYLFDKISIIPINKHYMLNLSNNGKFIAEEIKESDSKSKISKIINKKILKEKKIQINFNDGRNILSDIKCNINDSAIINFEENKIIKCLPMKENSRVFIFSGKHAGKIGKIISINKERKISEIEVNKEKINALIKQIIVIE